MRSGRTPGSSAPSCVDWDDPRTAVGRPRGGPLRGAPGTGRPRRAGPVPARHLAAGVRRVGRLHAGPGGPVRHDRRVQRGHRLLRRGRRPVLEGAAGRCLGPVLPSGAVAPPWPFRQRRQTDATRAPGVASPGPDDAGEPRSGRPAPGDSRAPCSPRLEELVASLVLGRGRTAVDILATWVWVLTHPLQIHRARRRRKPIPSRSPRPTGRRLQRRAATACGYWSGRRPRRIVSSWPPGPVVTDCAMPRRPARTPAWPSLWRYWFPWSAGIRGEVGVARNTALDARVHLRRRLGRFAALGVVDRLAGVRASANRRCRPGPSEASGCWERSCSSPQVLLAACLVLAPLILGPVGAWRLLPRGTATRARAGDRRRLRSVADRPQCCGEARLQALVAYAAAPWLLRRVTRHAVHRTVRGRRTRLPARVSASTRARRVMVGLVAAVSPLAAVVIVAGGADAGRSGARGPGLRARLPRCAMRSSGSLGAVRSTCRGWSLRCVAATWPRSPACGRVAPRFRRPPTCSPGSIGSLQIGLLGWGLVVAAAVPLFTGAGGVSAGPRAVGWRSSAGLGAAVLAGEVRPARRGRGGGAPGARGARAGGVDAMAPLAFEEDVVRADFGTRQILSFAGCRGTAAGSGAPGARAHPGPLVPARR